MKQFKRTEQNTTTRAPRAFANQKKWPIRGVFGNKHDLHLIFQLEAGTL